ncbi:MAG: hypothetical protein JSU81_00665 [Candidatus Coatesbacteria bacterium]|nr:MAG: hypothetical protein JSU81_00665 [Candidatus Coatesbacteria bacterium]
MDENKISGYVALGATVAGAFAFATYLRRVLTITGGADAAVVAAALAVLGMAAGASLVAVLGERAGRKAGATLAWNALLFGATAFLAGAAVAHLPLDLHGPAPGLTLALYLLAGAVPLGFVGFALGLAFRVCPGQPGRLYGAFLAGGAGGALLAAAALDLFGSGGTLAVVALLAAAGAVLFSAGRSKVKWIAAAAVAVAALVASVAVPSLFFPAAARQTFLGAAGDDVAAAKWSASGRAERLSGGAAAAAAYTAFDEATAEALGASPWLSQNGRGGVPFPADGAAALSLRRYAPVFAGRIKAPERALVVGGAGLEALALGALGAGRTDLAVAAETAELWGGLDYAADLFEAARVEVRRGHGRAFLRRQEGTYDLILLSPALVAASEELAPALEPDYLLTVEAFGEYYQRLAPEGALAVAVREGPAPTYAFKLAATMFEAWRAQGELQPAGCLAAFARDDVVTVIARRGGFEELELDALAGLAGEEVEPVYLPGRPGPGAGVADDYAAFLTAAAAGDYGSYEFDLRPARDDRPFPARLARGFGFSLTPAGAGPSFARAGVIAAVALAVIFLAVPVYCFKRQCVRTGGKTGFAAYFLLVGAALGTLAVSLEPKVAFYLGGGAWSPAAAQACWLGVAAAGSFFSARLARRRRWLPFVLLGAAVAAYFFVYEPIWAATAAWHWVLRLYLAVVLVAGVGFLAGTLAPVGLAAAAGREPATLPWAWAAYLFGFALASGVTLAAAPTAGFRLTIAAAFVILLGAWGALTWAIRSHLPPAPGEVGEGGAA